MNIVRRKGCASNVMQTHKGRPEVTVTSREVVKEVLVMSYGLTERSPCGCHPMNSQKETVTSRKWQRMF